MIGNNRSKRDTQTLAGQRGTEQQRAILWGEIDRLSLEIANRLLNGAFAKLISPKITAAAVDENALELYLNRSSEIDRINQLIDSTNAYIANLVVDLRADVAEILEEILVIESDVSDNYAAIVVEAGARANEDQALAGLVTTLQTRLGDAETSITNESQIRATKDDSLTNQVSTLQSNFASVSATVTQSANTLATMEGYAAATYSLRTKAGSAGAAIELVSADDPINGPASAVRIRADDILIDGTLFADHVNAASFASAGLGIFGGAVQSANYLAGVRGWRITQAGDAEFINLIAREAIINGEILTEKLANNAVTITRESSGTGNQTLSFSSPKDGALLIVASAQATKNVGNGPVTASAQIIVNGVVYATGSAPTVNNGPNPGTSDGNIALTTSFGFGAQSFTIQLTGDIVSGSIVVLERLK